MCNLALNFIRDCTSPLHAKLDKDSLLSKIARADCSYAEYQMAMCGLARAYQQIDIALLAGAPYCPAGLPSYVARVPFLLADLQQMGITSPAVPDSLLTPPSNCASYLGMRYVIEGANLGAKVIAINLSRSGISTQIMLANSFWSNTNPWQNCWPIMVRMLAVLQSRAEIAQSAWAARLTFRHFINCLLPQKE
ncbi:MAG: Heme oxygenase [Candidatus Nitrotoga sp. CP45]|nr:MAG: Heme oxygenase [Candidatus Nitrotoga sp. CP45]